MYRRLCPKHIWVLLCACLICPSFSFAEKDGQYIRLSEYLLLHPEQAQKMTQFSEHVRSPARPLKTPNKKTVKLAVIYPGEQTSSYWRKSVLTIKKRLTELNINYEVKTYFSRPGIDLALQSQQLNSAIQWNPDYLIFTLDALRHQAMIERILLRGSPKLILQNITTPLQRWSELKPFLYTGFDHEYGSTLLAQEMLKNEQKGDYSMLYFAPGYVSQMRGDTFIQHASKHPQLNKVSSYYTKGDRSIAYKATLNTLKKNPNINMLFACSTDIALGAADGLEEMGKLEQVVLNGWGGGENEIKALGDNLIDLTVMRMNDDSSVAIAEAVKLDLTQQTNSVPDIYSGDIVLIDREVDKHTIRKLEERAFRYSSNDKKHETD